MIFINWENNNKVQIIKILGGIFNDYPLLHFIAQDIANKILNNTHSQCMFHNIITGDVL